MHFIIIRVESFRSAFSLPKDAKKPQKAIIEVVYSNKRSISYHQAFVRMSAVGQNKG